MKYPGWNVDASLQYMKSSKKDKSWTKVFIEGLKKGEINITYFPKIPKDIHESGFLLSKGFKYKGQYDTKEEQDLYTKSYAIPGEVAITENPYSDDGHISVYDGKQWFSPNLQNGMYAFGHNKNPKTKSMTCHVYHWGFNK